MAYNIMGVNPGHNGSVALISDGEIKYYLEEERVSRQKYDGNPFRSMIDVMSKFHVDELIIGGGSQLPSLPWTGEDPYTALVRKFYPKVKVTNMTEHHHIGHAAIAFFNSGFDEAVAIIVDGAGSYKKEKVEVAPGQEMPAEGFEAETIWVCRHRSDFASLYRVHGSNVGFKLNDMQKEFDSATTIVKTYESVTDYLGFGYIEAGKTMGLAPYGKKDANIPPLFVGARGSKDIFIPNYPAGGYVDQARNEVFRQKVNPKEWHTDPSKLSDIEKNLAWQVQHDTQELVAGYIENAVRATGMKKIVIAGGYGLNCVANYFYKKRFPDLDIYVEPISHDGGTAIGIAQYMWYNRYPECDHVIHPQTTLYYGPEYSLETLENTLSKHMDSIKTEKITHEEVAKLISERNIVSIFQGRSEAGPRALGNRSIVYDSRDPNGKDYVNTVKGREWFRPFAGSVLKEDAQEWFDMAGMEESPFMMYAVNVAADKLEQIPCVTHVDDTCRVQTVTEEQNKHYYKLIKAFKDITNVPVLFNTSFNLAGEPLVETMEDALHTLYSSRLKYLYVPELGILVTKTIEDPVKKDEVEKVTVELVD